MATQEERLTTLEQAATNTQKFQNEAIRQIRDINDAVTILVGLTRAHNHDIHLIFERLDTIDTEMEQRFDLVDARLNQMYDEINNHTAMLHQILEKLDERTNDHGSL